MNVPTFPTDNLYKFVAISGLFICIFSIVFPMTRISEIKHKIIELQTKSAILNIEIEELKVESANLDKDLERITKKMDLEKSSQKDREIFRKELSELREKDIEQGQKLTKLRIKNKELKGQKN